MAFDSESIIETELRRRRPSNIITYKRVIFYNYSVVAVFGKLFKLRMPVSYVAALATHYFGDREKIP